MIRKIVYRVQDMNGNGAYYGGLGSQATDYLYDIDRYDLVNLAQRAGPVRDFYSAHRGNTWSWVEHWRFAFPSVEAAYRWFPYPAMALLEARGFFLQAVEADVVLLSDSGEQVVYRVIPPEPEAGDVRGIA